MIEPVAQNALIVGEDLAVTQTAQPTRVTIGFVRFQGAPSPANIASVVDKNAKKRDSKVINRRSDRACADRGKLDQALGGAHAELVSLASRLLAPSQAKVRSTIHVRPVARKE